MQLVESAMTASILYWTLKAQAAQGQCSLRPAQPPLIAFSSRRNLSERDPCHRVALNASQPRAASCIANGGSDARRFMFSKPVVSETVADTDIDRMGQQFGVQFAGQLARCRINRDVIVGPHGLIFPEQGPFFRKIVF